MAKHQKKGVWEALVPIAGQHLKRALADQGLTVRGIAKELGLSPVSLQYIVSGQQRRVRLPVFRQLVDRLRGTLSRTQFGLLLSGQLDRLPANISVPLLAGRDLDAHLARGGEDDVDHIAGPAFQTVLRDVRDVWSYVAPSEDPAVLTARVERLYGLDSWRTALFDFAAAAPPEERTAAADLASRFWRLVLRPLFEDIADVRPDARGRLWQTMRAILTAPPTAPRRRTPKHPRPKRSSPNRRPQ